MKIGRYKISKLLDDSTLPKFMTNQIGSSK